MKPEICQSLAAINQAMEQLTLNIAKLRNKEVLVPDFAEIRILEVRQTCTDINLSALHHLAAKELADGGKVGRELSEKRRVYSDQEATTPATDTGKDASGENGQRAQDGSESA